MKTSVDLSDESLDGLANSIRMLLEQDSTKREAFIQFAVSEMVQWMSGGTRYLSLTDQHLNWLEELLILFYPEETPSTDRLFNDFSVPYGRAAYISRVLVEKQHSSWRKKGQKMLRAALQRQNEDAVQLVNDGDPLKRLSVSIDKVSHRELRVLVSEIIQQDDALPPPVNKHSFGDQRTVEIPSILFKHLLERLEVS